MRGHRPSVPREPQMSVPEPSWSDRTPVSLLEDSLGGSHSALGPTAPHLPTPTAREGPAVSSDLGLGNFLEPQDERGTCHCYWPVIPETPAQLFRGPPTAPQMDTKPGAWPRAAWCSPAFLRCSRGQAAGLEGSAQARPRLAAVGSSFPKPTEQNRGSVLFQPSRAPTQRLPRFPVPGEGTKN